MKIAIIGCSSQKHLQPCIAAEMYRNQLFKLSLAYARLVSDDIRIVSGKYALIRPTSRLQPYQIEVELGHYNHYLKSATRTAFNRHLGGQLRQLRKKHQLIYLCNNFFTDLGPDGERPLYHLNYYGRLRFLREKLRTQ
jgi:hypothetical protein